MNSQDAQFFKAMGARISQTRREKGLTQQQVADHLGIPQQTYAHYEVGDVRIPASTLPLLGQMLGLTPNDLLGHSATSRKSKPGPMSKLDQQIERIRQLPKTKQHFVMEMLDMVIAQAGH
ncbi:MAG: helix-turn-helix transcriptional regulator [Puia sp.]|nr:helix-turn-helix transcriptional regulator [Puia sp.]